jgi:hypothetical protein
VTSSSSSAGDRAAAAEPDTAAAAAESIQGGMNTRTPNGGGAERLTPETLAHPIALFLKARNVAEDDRLNWLRTRAFGEMLANIIAAHRNPPRTGELGHFEVNASRIGFAMRERWGRWDVREVIAAMPRVESNRRARIAPLATLGCVKIAEEIIAEKIAAGVKVRSYGNLLAKIIEDGEAAAVLLDRTHAAHVAAAKKLAAKERADAAALERSAQLARDLGPSELESAALRERLAAFDDAALAAMWAAMLATIDDPGAKRNLSRPHFTNANGELRDRILSGTVARREMSRYLASLENRA